MTMKTLKDLFLSELADTYDAERRLVKALPKMARAATCKKLKAALESHLKETEEHVEKLEQVFQAFDSKARGQTCEATVGLVKEAEEIAADFKGSPAINAGLIAAAQKVEHYEMASYGCLHEWAGLLENEQAAVLLQEILDQERAANGALTELARASSNQDALAEAAPAASTNAPNVTTGSKSAGSARGVRPVQPVSRLTKPLARTRS